VERREKREERGESREEGGGRREEGGERREEGGESREQRGDITYSIQHSTKMCGERINNSLSWGR
jgi:hypothetical protein